MPHAGPAIVARRKPCHASSIPAPMSSRPTRAGAPSPAKHGREEGGRSHRGHDHTGPPSSADSTFPTHASVRYTLVVTGARCARLRVTASTGLESAESRSFAPHDTNYRRSRSDRRLRPPSRPATRRARPPRARARAATGGGRDRRGVRRRVRVADVFDAASLRAGLAGCDVGINLATSLPGPSGPRRLRDERSRPPRRHADLGRRVPRRRRLARRPAEHRHGERRRGRRVGRRGHGLSADGRRRSPRSPSRRRSRWRTTVRESGLDWLILRGGLFYGPGTGFDDDWFARARAGTLRLPGEGRTTSRWSTSPTWRKRPPRRSIAGRRAGR